MLRAALVVTLFLATNASLILLFRATLPRFLLGFGLWGSGTLLMLYLLFHPRNQWLVANRFRVECGDRPCVALTFDDGPTPDHTERLLAVLHQKNVVATFFVVGERAERHPQLLRRLAGEGHVIGNHTYSHRSMFCFLTPGRLRDEINRPQETIERICGVRPRYFRSPVGLRHPLLGVYLREAGLEYISWKIRTFDTLLREPRPILRRVLEQVAPGDIILMHDSDSAGVTLELLPRMIDELRNRGFEFVTVESRSPAEVRVSHRR